MFNYVVIIISLSNNKPTSLLYESLSRYSTSLLYESLSRSLLARPELAPAYYVYIPIPSQFNDYKETVCRLTATTLGFEAQRKFYRVGPFIMLTA